MIVASDTYYSMSGDKFSKFAKTKIMAVLENDLEKIEEISDSELKLEIAILLYEKDKISLRKAAKMLVYYG